MEHAWLDSLSEDWVSQPGSDTSAAQLPPLKITDSNSKPKIATPSRIPRRAVGARPQQSATQDSSFNVLSEQSSNDINKTSQRLSSKPSQPTKYVPGGRTSRSVSAASIGSVIHNTVQHKSSPGKTNGETPEWKRRLVYGNIQYGEQRDLFCSAAAGLQDMFKPPPPLEENAATDSEQQESTMPSSPPGYPQRIVSGDLDDLDVLDDIEDLEDENETLYPNEVTPSPSPRKAQREIKYKLNVDDSMAPSQPSDFSQQDSSPTQRRDEVYRDHSCLSAPSDDGSVIRKASGQSVIRNEDFSPILIGKHSDQDGKVDFAPIEVPADQLKQKLEKLRINQMLLDSQIDPRTGFDVSGQDGTATVENTEDYARNGGFLNLQRGGRSGDGSFRYRALSPGLGGDSSEMLPEESLQASTPKQFPSIRTEATNPYQNDYFSLSPSMPRAPFPSPEKKQQASRSHIPSAGSPLKLFGPYDTFTNQTLLRRISQFEEGTSGNTSRQSLGSVIYQDRSQSPVEGFMAASNPHKLPQIPQDSSLPRPRTVSQFGAGDLEGYEFSGDDSYASHDESAFSDKENALPRPLSSHPVEPIFQHPLQPSSPDSDSELFVRRRRNTTSSSSMHSRTVSSSSQIRKPISPAMGAPEISGTPMREGSEGKRQRTSPSKDPTPKRRRTLHRSDIAFGREDQMAAVDTASRQMQSAMGKKRKDARPGDFELANPNVLALRSILRPRTPTPSQRSSQQREQHPFAEEEQEFVDERPKKSPIRPLQNENMPPSSEVPIETDRKPSIRTQDFVDQAAQIMAMIRNQVRAPGLASLEESEAENGTPSPDEMYDSYQSSTKEPFSRPPSREGRPLPRLPARQENPELIDRLKKYQELSDMGDVITSSMRSMGALAKDAFRAAHEIERQIDESSRSRSDGPYITDEEVISDPPNIRLSTNPFLNGLPGSPVRDYHSNSSANSTNRTYPTASSRGSDSRKTIMPESVSHLIPDRVGSMYLDKQNNIWIKKKEARFTRSANILPSEDSEDDPFASIPDLSVDLTREMNNLLLTTAQKARTSANLDEIGSPVSPSGSPRPQASRGYVTLSPDAQLSPNMATLAREEIEKLDARAMEGSEVDEEVEVEREISIIEGRDDSPPSTTRRRNLTISFSSPVASIIQDVVAEDLDGLEDDPQVLEEENVIPTPKKSPGYPSVGKSVLKNGGHGSMRSNHTGSRRHVSSGPAFIPRPVSRIEEQDEESTIEIPVEDQRQVSYYGETSIISHKTPDGRHTSLSFIINQSPDKQVSVQADESALIGLNVGKLSLSPLSEFTLNNSDQSFGFEVSYVMGHRHMATGDGSKKVMSMTIRELVDKLSEVEPFEPYWEDMTELDLHEKRLGSLHMLDEFCGKLVTLDASKNSLGHLNGVPSGVRQLKVSHNMLTELTSWDHLMNLQYVDISGNELKSLSALKNLVHLRSIKADNNQLTSLDGLDVHDGLLSLRARDNLIEEVDFGNIKMDRLTELDLEGNRITSVRGLERLPLLSKLRLGKNRLQNFTVKTIIKTLRQLDLGDNELTSLDISNLPSLHSLHADRNRIADITGFGRARRLDSLSLREQRGEQPLDLNFLAKAYEIRKLFLSGNYLGVFEPKVDFLNLQLLELANCGLQYLPENLGQLTPNLRTLNINFNAIGDLSPLQFIPRMKKLLVAGNRLADSTSVTELLTDFPHLTQVDLRDNPVTIGFYAPLQVLVSVCHIGFVDPFSLPEADGERDEMFASRLDEATKLRRRLHQIVFAASCKRLRMLDGLPIQRQKVLSKDGLYQTLVAEGLLPDETLIGEDDSSQKVMRHEPKVQHPIDSIRSSRWNAEDSFA
ncbi:Fc.00g009040.m01.CDS01 [Cosmosporella sp. VM-42]